MRYVMGVDAGGTKSHLVLFDLDGKLAGAAVWGSLNHEMLPGSFDQFAQELDAFITKALTPLSLATKDIACAVFGISGADTEEQHQIIGDIINALGFPRWHLYNDAFLGIPAGSPEGEGICAINGTGATVAGINAQGDKMQLGGIGNLSDDKGGAGYLGNRVLNAVYTALFRDGRNTILADALFHKLNIDDKAHYVEALTSRINDDSLDVAQLNRLLFSCGDQGDQVSLDILAETAENYAGAIRHMTRELNFSSIEIHITLAGSVFVKEKSPLLRDMLKNNILQSMPSHRFDFTVLDIPPVGGAILWAFEKLNLHHLREKLHSELKRMELLLEMKPRFS